MSLIIYNNTYTVQDVVKQMHRLPHLDSALQTTSNDFGIYTDSTWNDYTKSLLPLPLICMSLGLLSLLIFQCTVCCCGCFRKAPLPGTQRVNEWSATLSLRYLLGGFILMTVVVVLFDQVILFGNGYLSSGISTSDDALNYLQNTFNDLNTYGNDLIVDGYHLRNDFTNATIKDNCQQAATLNAYLVDYFTYVDEYLSYISDVPDKCSNAQDALHQYGVHDKNSSIWAFYSMFIVCAGILLVGMLFSNKYVIFGGFCTMDLMLFFVFIFCS